MSMTLLDGGMGQELVRRSGQATSLWSVQALLDEPDLVLAVHRDFFASGAEVATTNTYSVLPDRLEAHGIPEQLETLTHLACRLAVQARDEYGSGRVAGSLGPQGFSYQPDNCPPAAEAAAVYASVCELQSAYVDLFIGETMSSVDQLRGFLMAASGRGKPVWCAVSVDDDDGSLLRSGEPVTKVLPLLSEFHADAVLVNCSRPEAVSQALPSLVDAGLPVGAYANGFEAIAAEFDHIGATVDALTTRKDLDAHAYAHHAEHWAELGATIIGGCCEVGPDHIAELSRRFKGPLQHAAS